MCRRAIQSICIDAGVEGSNKVVAQLADFKSLIRISEESEDSKALDAIILIGHDGAHPHLPVVDQNRAELLLIILQDVLDGIYNKPGRIRAAAKLRSDAIERYSTKGV